MLALYPARAGGPWLWSTLVLFLFHALVVPSGFRTRVQPQRWITIWWWCDTKSHMCEGARGLEVRHDVGAGGVVPGLCSEPVPALACVRGSCSRGCEARGKARGRPSHPGATGEGKAGRANMREPLI